MSKKTHQSGYRVVIEPRRLGDFGFASVSDSMMSSGEEDRQRQYRERCEDIVTQVKRHVDDIGHAYVECDTDDVCEHCGARWTEKSPHYNGGCCEADESAQLAREAA